MKGFVVDNVNNSNYIYETVPKITVDELNEAIAFNNKKRICTGIIYLSLYYNNKRKVESICFKLLKRYNDFEIARSSIVALSHIIRLQGHIDIFKLRKYERTVKDPKTEDYIDMLWGDICIYYKGTLYR